VSANLDSFTVIKTISTGVSWTYNLAVEEEEKFVFISDIYEGVGFISLEILTNASDTRNALLFH
jgi:hypothetical protein